MKISVIKEFGELNIDSMYELDLSKTEVKDCCGCWSCWWTTPGRCINKELDIFYSKYLEADKVVFFSKVTKGLVSGNLKTLFDRMIPLFLPYIEYSKGESRHLTRYEKYPDIEFYYDGEFSSEEGKKVFEDYILRTFDQFASKNVVVKAYEKYVEEIS